jgi:two-component system cell cycle sensor histidine kinase/response regulator CckA
MAAKLLDEPCLGAANLNSSRGITSAIEDGATVTPPSMVSTAVGATMLGETIPAATFVEPQTWGGPETILLVEDEGFVRKVTAEVLESAGYKVVIAHSSSDALDAYRRLSVPVDLLLADIVMPGMSGRDLATEFESLCPRARVLLMSGYAGQLASCLLSPCGKTYLAKPFSARMLLIKVREVLDTNPFDRGAEA